VTPDRVLATRQEALERANADLDVLRAGDAAVSPA
jgi:hypothetical protein